MGRVGMGLGGDLRILTAGVGQEATKFGKCRKVCFEPKGDINIDVVRFSLSTNTRLQQPKGFLISVPNFAFEFKSPMFRIIFSPRRMTFFAGIHSIVVMS